MNFRTESFDFPQNEQRRCLSWDIATPGDDWDTSLPRTNSRARTGQYDSDAARIDHVKLFTKVSCAASLSCKSCCHGGLFRGLNDFAALCDDIVDQPVRFGFLRRHVIIAHDVTLDLLDRTTRVLRHELIHLRPQIQDFARLNLDVGRGALRATGRLVDHDPRVWERRAATLSARCEQERAHAGREAHARGV